MGDGASGAAGHLMSAESAYPVGEVVHGIRLWLLAHEVDDATDRSAPVQDRRGPFEHVDTLEVVRLRAVAITGPAHAIDQDHVEIIPVGIEEAAYGVLLVGAVP